MEEYGKMGSFGATRSLTILLFHLLALGIFEGDFSLVMLLLTGGICRHPRGRWTVYTVLASHGTVIYLSIPLKFFLLAGWESRWVQSEHKGKEFGAFKLTAGKFFGDAEEDKGIQTSQVRYKIPNFKFMKWNSNQIENLTFCIYM